MEENTQQKLTYEQLEKIAVQLQQRASNAEARLNSINMAATRLNYLFEVLKLASLFDTEFITKCVNEVKTLMEVDEVVVEEK